MEDASSYALNCCTKKNLTELSSNVTLQSLPQFWISLEKEHPSLSYGAIKLLIIFSTRYVWDFSALSLTKIKPEKPNAHQDSTLSVGNNIAATIIKYSCKEATVDLNLFELNMAQQILVLF